MRRAVITAVSDCQVDQFVVPVIQALTIEIHDVVLLPRLGLGASQVQPRRLLELLAKRRFFSRRGALLGQKMSHVLILGGRPVGVVFGGGVFVLLVEVIWGGVTSMVGYRSVLTFLLWGSV